MRDLGPDGSLRDDRGAGALDYVGATVVAVAIVAALLGTSVDSRLADKFRCLLSFSGGTCATGNGDPTAAPKTDADYEPPLCQISAISDKAGSKAKFLFWEFGKEYGFQEQHFQSKTDLNKDGKVDDKDKMVMMTFTDAASIAAKKEFKPGLKVGKLGSDTLELGAGVKVTNGDTWVFESEEEAKRFRDDIEKLQMYEMRRTMPGGAEASVGDSILYLFGTGPLKEEEETRERIERDLGKNRNITYGKLGLEGSASGGLKLSAGDDKKLSATLGGNVKLAPEVTWTDNNYKGTKAYTYSMAIEYGTKVGYEAGPLNGEHSAQTTQTGTITVTKDKKTGEIVRIDMTRTVEKNATKDGVKGKGDNGKDGDDKKTGSGGIKGSDAETGIDVVTNSIVIPKGDQGAADRKIVEDWLAGNNEMGTAWGYMFDDQAPTKRPGDDDPFGQLMFDKGMSSKTKYTGKTDAAEYGFDLNLGLSLGFSISTERKEETLNDAEFLGAPQGGSRSYVPYSYCAN
ncbi:hypothetical protein [Streptomyces tritici]|uniref:hypothetical protein n=1 Tax=Streptomyces tritici TaxID=2054410 RepID=UPI003AF01106